MNETIRVKTTPDGSDTYLKTSINQDFDFIEILSLKISQEDVYRKYCSDYGVVVGRVNINQGFGVPNAKVSIFIPLDEIDINNPEIRGLYPYEVITDKNDDGIRYNLLPSNADESNECFTPVGSFPSKNDILDNPIMEVVYEKYYKFTTTTNHAGDFMFFGVPLGTYTVHVDADISNIGIASQRPYDLITQGTPIALFDSSTKFKGDKNLNKLVQIKTLNSGVNIQPFWGDVDSCEVGINRLDFDFNYNIIPSAIFMGSIFGDEGKHSVNKNCQPNKNVGQICEQVSTSGTINMIRKNLNGEIEEYDINGGRLIDEEGAWAYQIPMNLDYMITDENGNLAFSDDPTKGIPTRARVRFSIGMDENGGEGRLRTRAKYLVPNNPTNTNQIDYTFGKETKDTSFRDLYWNKIYTVSNYITRYQKNDGKENRGTTGIKNVDNCVSVKNPFPYNKVDSNMNPIFFILCILILAIQEIVRAVNIVVAGINFVISGIRSICRIRIPGIGRPFGALCVDYVQCVFIKCKQYSFAPGCSGHGKDGITNIKTSGLDECLLILLTEVLTVFELDFYNDWINGTLFSYLIKYKKRKSHHKFCDYECDTNESSNDCHSSYLIDSCIGGDEDNIVVVRADEGLVKRVGDEFFYAATTHDTNHKMFATEIVNLGAVFECDWQGIPKINEALQTTSYILPPDLSEYNETNTIRETCGMFSLNNNTNDAFFFTISCDGTDVDAKGCLNLRHMTEIGVNLSEGTIDAATGAVVTEGNCFIGAEDIDEGIGHLFRDVFFSINHTATPWIGINFFDDRKYTTDFNTRNVPEYNFTSVADNGQDYITFRGYSAGNNTYSETKHSYYFYFGLVPGKSALDKMNNRFFNKCTIIEKSVLTIVSSSTPDSSNTGIGTLTFKFVGGKPNYSYQVTGPSYQVSGTIDNSEVLLTGLNDGTYTINGLDSFNTPVSKTVVISGPKPLSTFVYVSKNATTNTSTDGQITISSISGGFGPYSYKVTSGSGNVIVPTTIITSTPLQINGLGVDEVIGYTVTVYDSIGSSVITTGLKITGVPILSITSTVVNPTCFDSFDGAINHLIVGGQPPYSVKTTGPDEFTSNSINVTEIGKGTYVTELTDSTESTPISVTNTLVATSPEIVLSLPTDSNVLRKQCDPTKHKITVFASFSSNAPSNVIIGYFDENSDSFVEIANVPYVNASTPIVFYYPNINYQLTLAIKLGECYSNEVILTQGMVAKPNTVLVCNIASLGIVNGSYTFNVSGTGGIGNYTGTGIFTSATPSYTATITDSVGCTATKSI